MTLCLPVSVDAERDGLGHIVPCVLRPGDVCPRCGEEKLDHDGALNDDGERRLRVNRISGLRILGRDGLPKLHRYLCAGGDDPQTVRGLLGRRLGFRGGNFSPGFESGALGLGWLLAWNLTQQEEPDARFFRNSFNADTLLHDTPSGPDGGPARRSAIVTTSERPLASAIGNCRWCSTPSSAKTRSTSPFRSTRSAPSRCITVVTSTGRFAIGAPQKC